MNFIKLDKKLHELPLTKTNPKTLESLFGNANAQAMWVADMEFQIADPIRDALISRIQGSGFGYEYRPNSLFDSQKKWYAENYKLELEKDQLLYSPTIVTSLAIILDLYLNNDESVLIQPPVFMEFRSTIRKVRKRLVKNSLILEDNRYKIDFADLDEKLSDPKM